MDQCETGVRDRAYWLFEQKVRTELEYWHYQNGHENSPPEVMTDRVLVRVDGVEYEAEFAMRKV